MTHMESEMRRAEEASIPEALAIEIPMIVVPRALIPHGIHEEKREMYTILQRYLADHSTNPELKKSLLEPKGFGFRGITRNPKKVVPREHRDYALLTLQGALENIQVYGNDRRLPAPPPTWISIEYPSTALDHAIDHNGNYIGIVMVYRGADSMIEGDSRIMPGVTFSWAKEFAHLRTYKSRLVGAFMMKFEPEVSAEENNSGL